MSRLSDTGLDNAALPSHIERYLPRADTDSPDCIFLSVRIPKCASTSMTRMLDDAFARRRVFYLPHTLDLDGAVSSTQNLRFRRTQARNLFSRYGTFSLKRACEMISRTARPGDLIGGGHLDYGTVSGGVGRKLKIITMLREPSARCRSEYHYLRKKHAGKAWWARPDSGLREKIAAKYDFDGFLDFLLEHEAVYGNIAARSLHWNGVQPLAEYWPQHIFHAGVVEDIRSFAGELTAKLGERLSLPRLNTTDAVSDAPMTRKQHAKIERLYPKDIALYEWCMTSDP